jgi:hypothetical protein
LLVFRGIDEGRLTVDSVHRRRELQVQLSGTCDRAAITDSGDAHLSVALLA